MASCRVTIYECIGFVPVKKWRLGLASQRVVAVSGGSGWCPMRAWENGRWVTVCWPNDVLLQPLSARQLYEKKRDTQHSTKDRWKRRRDGWRGTLPMTNENQDKWVVQLPFYISKLLFSSSSRLLPLLPPPAVSRCATTALSLLLCCCCCCFSCTTIPSFSSHPSANECNNNSLGRVPTLKNRTSPHAPVSFTVCLPDAIYCLECFQKKKGEMNKKTRFSFLRRRAVFFFCFVRICKETGTEGLVRASCVWFGSVHLWDKMAC